MLKLIPARIENGLVVPVTPLPDAGTIRSVSLLVEVNFPTPGKTSIFDLFGKAPVLRSGEDIDAQIREERDSWNEEPN